jgi:hypothetical protein
MCFAIATKYLPTKIVGFDRTFTGYAGASSESAEDGVGEGDSLLGAIFDPHLTLDQLDA